MVQCAKLVYSVKTAYFLTLFQFFRVRMDHSKPAKCYLLLSVNQIHVPNEYSNGCILIMQLTDFKCKLVRKGGIWQHWALLIWQGISSAAPWIPWFIQLFCQSVPSICTSLPLCKLVRKLFSSHSAETALKVRTGRDRKRPGISLIVNIMVKLSPF